MVTPISIKKWKSQRNWSPWIIFEIRSVIFDCFDHARRVQTAEFQNRPTFDEKRGGTFSEFFGIFGVERTVL